MNDLLKTFERLMEALAEGGGRAKRIRERMKESRLKEEARFKAADKALTEIRAMTEEDWWEKCYLENIQGSGAPTEWLIARRDKEFGVPPGRRKKET